MSERVTTTAGRSEATDTVLEVRDVSVTYETGRGRSRVLDDVSIDVQRGETLGIVGESGSGKSMFASTLMDAVVEPGVVTGEVIYHPTDGDPVDVLDLTTRELKQLRWEEIAMVYQGAMSAFNPTLTIRTHFRETLEAHNYDTADGLDRARELIRDLNLDPDRMLDAYQHELSGGEKQRVMIALSLIFDPEVLILDEPVAALDLLMQRSLLKMLAEIKEEYELTLISITHDMSIVSGLADRLAVAYGFDFVELGPARDVLVRPEHPYTRMLLRTSLDMDIPLDEVTTIDGNPPDPINVPTGCSFHPRCPVADDRCEIEEPELRAEAGRDHAVACYYPDLATERIPFSLGDDGGDES